MKKKNKRKNTIEDYYRNPRKYRFRNRDLGGNNNGISRKVE